MKRDVGGERDGRSQRCDWAARGSSRVQDLWTSALPALCFPQAVMGKDTHSRVPCAALSLPFACPLLCIVRCQTLSRRLCSSVFKQGVHITHPALSQPQGHVMAPALNRACISRCHWAATGTIRYSGDRDHGRTGEEHKAHGPKHDARSTAGLAVGPPTRANAQSNRN